MEIDHEIFSTVLLSLPQIKEGQLSVSDELASVAQLDARSTGDLEVVGSTPTGSATLFLEIDHAIFSTVILSHLLIQEGQLSLSNERMCTIG